MDVQMPVMDGLEATRRIRTELGLADLWIVAMTANASTQDKEHCMEAGMNAFVSKPISPERLYSAVAAMKQRQPPASDEAAPGSDQEDVSEARPFAGDPDIIDLSVLAAVLNNDPEKTRKFALRFLETAKQGLADAEASLAQGDLVALAALGHRNKSSARAAGSAGLAWLWHSVERLKDGKDLDHAELIMRRIRLLLQRIEAHVSALFDA
jgi:CheY-like chemotaxis protein